MTSIRHSQTRSEDHHPLIVLIICRQAPHHLVKVLWFPSSKLKGFTNRFADDSLLLLISSLPCGVQFVPGWLTGLAPHVAGGQVQHPGLGVHHLEGVRVHLIDPVARTKARVASNAIQWSIFRDKLTLKQILPRGNKPHPRGPGGVIRVIMKREVVVVSVAVELASDALLKPDESAVQCRRVQPRLPRDDPGVLPAPGAQTLRVAGRHVAQDVHLFPGRLRRQELLNQPDQHVACNDGWNQEVGMITDE